MTWQGKNSHLPSTVALQFQWKQPQSNIWPFEEFQFRPIGRVVRADIQAPRIMAFQKILKKEAKISFDNIFTRNGHITATSTRQIINPYLITALSTSHPHVASHKRGSSLVNSAWQGGKSCPGGGPGEEAQHRKSVRAKASSSNNIFLCMVQKLIWLKWYQSHPSGRNGSAGVYISILRQLGKLLDKAVHVVPEVFCNTNPRTNWSNDRSERTQL